MTLHGVVWMLVLLAAWALTAGCGGKDESAGKVGPEGLTDAEQKAAGKAEASLEISSSAFAQGETIPTKYTGFGENISPPLAWTGVPNGTAELVLIVDDPDAPSPQKPRPEGPWVHWLLYKIPADRRELPEGFSGRASPDVPAPMRQGENSAGNTFYHGPKPPIGTHRYFFKLYALDAPLDVPAGASKDQLVAALHGHVLAHGSLMGTRAAE